MKKFSSSTLLKDSTRSRFLVWTTTCIAFLFLIAFVLPRKGFDFTDHGYYLYSSFLMSHLTMPTEGNAYFFYALFIKLGLWNYYFYELFYFLFLTASISVFWSAFKPIKESYTFPFALLIGLSANFTYMLTYQHAPFCLLLMGFGFIFHALKKESIVLCVLGSLALGYAATTNISLFPTVIITGALLSVLAKNSTIKIPFHLSYWPTAVFCIVFSILSRVSFFQLNSDPRFSMPVLIAKIPHLFWFLISSNPLPVIFIATILALSLLSKPVKLEKFEKSFLLIMLLYLVWFVVHAYFQQARHHGPQRNIINSGVFYSYFAAMIYAMYFRFDEFFLKITLFVIALMSYSTIMSIATLGDFASHMSFAAPASVTVGCLIFEQYCDDATVKKIFNMLMIAFTIMSMFFFANYTFRSYPLLETKTVMTDKKMFGVVENDAKVNMLNKMEALYQKNHCGNKLFVAYPSMPFLYYYFRREAPLHQPWLSDSVGYITSQQMIKELKTNKHWCVITAPEFNHAPKNYFAPVNKFLKRHSAKKYTINTTGVDKNNINMPKSVIVYIK